MANKKVKMKVSRGNPAGGPIIRAGATVELPEFWANQFIADGTAEEVKTEKVKGKKDGESKG